MKTTKLVLLAGAQALGAFLYVLGAAWVISHAEVIFGQMQKFWAPVAFLLFFVFSATVEGTLVLGLPIYFFLTDRKKEAIKLFGFILVLFGIITALVFFFVVLTK